MLCLNCIHARDGIPERVEVEVRVNEEVEKVDIADELRKLWKAVEERGYTIIVFCSATKEIKGGAPPNPTTTITECAEFAEA